MASIIYSTTYQVWEEGNHSQIAVSENVMRQKLDYIHQNPVKRGYVDKPERWRYSSERNYAGMNGLIEVIRVWQHCWKLELPKPVSQAGAWETA